MVFRYRTIVLVVVFCISSRAAAGDRPESHAIQLRTVSQQVMTTAVTEGLHLPVTAVSLVMKPTPLNDLVKQSVIQSLRSRIEAVFVDSPGADTVLTYQALESSVSYGSPFSKTFLGSKFIERSVAIDVEVSMTVLRTNAVIYSSSIRSTSVDTVQYSSLRLLDESAPPFITITPAAYTFFDSIIEPAVVTIASAVAIYLFFTIRS
jgi:hypothetical protein